MITKTDHSTNATSIQVHILAMPLMAHGLASIVQSAAPTMHVASKSSTVADCLSALQPDTAQVVLAELEGPDMLESISALSSHSAAKVLVLTVRTQHDLLDEIILAGARGVVSKSEQPAALLRAIERVHCDEIWVDRETTARILTQLLLRQGEPAAAEPNSAQTKIASLSRRERQIVEALAADASAPGKVIADRLNISEHTLRNHLTTVYEKLNVHGRVELYAFAHEHGVFSTSAQDKIGVNRH
jgi:two-component system nitrate/nitrite response regulator NarL